MKFYQRFAYYLVGLVIGSFFVAMVLSGKDTRCNYFPNARVLNDLRNKPFNYSEIASEKLAEEWIDTIDIKNTLTYGDVDFDKSNKKIVLSTIAALKDKPENEIQEYLNKHKLEKVSIDSIKNADTGTIDTSEFPIFEVHESTEQKKNEEPK